MANIEFIQGHRVRFAILYELLSKFYTFWHLVHTVAPVEFPFHYVFIGLSVNVPEFEPVKIIFSEKVFQSSKNGVIYEVLGSLEIFAKFQHLNCIFLE